MLSRASPLVPGQAYRQAMRVVMTDDAAAFVAANGGRLWVWAARPRMCCLGAPAWMHAATTPPDGIFGFSAVPDLGAAGNPEVFFRPVGGLRPDVLEIAMHGRRNPEVAAYWDGCLMAMT